MLILNYKEELKGEVRYTMSRQVQAGGQVLSIGVKCLLDKPLSERGEDLSRKHIARELWTARRKLSEAVRGARGCC